VLILDESADEKAGEGSIGAGRQYNGRLGKVELSQVSVTLTYAHRGANTWEMVDGELYLPPAWFDEAHAALRQKLGLPATRQYADHAELGLRMIDRAINRKLPFRLVACDAAYGRSREFRAALDDRKLLYAAAIPMDTQVYLQLPRIGIPPRQGSRGRLPSVPKVLSRHAPAEVQALAASSKTVWQRHIVRNTERGKLIIEAVVFPVWTLSADGHVRREWLLIRRHLSGREVGKLTYILLNHPLDTPVETLVQDSCQRYFIERTYQDAKSELGWADFQAQKYRAWQHHLALTALALWFIAETKLDWQAHHPRDPKLKRQLKVKALPQLSVANVRDLLRAALPLPNLSQADAERIVVNHLINRARSTRSYADAQRHFHDPSV
jgi:SRSO17 transposase